MSDPRHQASEPVPTVLQQTYAKLSPLLFKTLLGMIFIAFSVLFIMILAKLPGAF